MYNKLRLQAATDFKLVSLWRHFILDPTLWSPIGQSWPWIMADYEILNLLSKKTVFG